MALVRTWHLACFVLCLIALSAVFTQRHILANDSSKYALLIDEVSSRLKNAFKIGRNDSTAAKTDSYGEEGARGIVKEHPHVSPRAGTDISERHHEALLNCFNQSHCIVPDLQLQRQFKVYFCTKGVHQGIRFFYLVREGLLLHPSVQMLPFSRIHEADLVVYLPGSSPWHKTECTNTRLLVLEEFDGSTMYAPLPNAQAMRAAYGPSMRWYFMYFKRSFIKRRDGKFLKFRGLDEADVYPMVYSIGNAYSQLRFNQDRPLAVTCTLRGNKEMTTRLRVQNWVSSFVRQNNLSHRSVTGELNHDTRTKISAKYFVKLYTSEIVVTVNPANWEGDFRLWESMASGALVMVDHLFVPYPHPLVDGKHIVFFDNNNETEFMSKLMYYHTHPEEARKIAVAGYLFAMRYHRTVSMVDYFLRSAHLKMAQEEEEEGSPLELPRYRYTGQFLVNETRHQARHIAKSNRPGSFLH